MAGGGGVRGKSRRFTRALAQLENGCLNGSLQTFPKGMYMYLWRAVTLGLQVFVPVRVNSARRRCGQRYAL